MSAFSDALSVSSSGLRAQADRLRVVSENIANVDTPGYRRKILSVEQAPTAADAFIATRIELDQTEGERSYDPASPLADAEGYVTASNVSLVTEMADMREANRGYEANLNSFRQARSMYQSLLDILRR